MKLSDGEKLIILMLTDMYKAIKINGEFDPDFVPRRSTTTSSGASTGTCPAFRLNAEDPPNPRGSRR
jgi:hypothetical protein